MVPVPVILTMFVVAFGLALLAGNGTAYVQLRREDNWPPTRPAGTSDVVPSRPRILVGLAIGLVMVLWGVATFVAEGYSL